VTPHAKSRHVTTDAEGNFAVPLLTPGNYDLTVRAPGFEPLVLKSVRVQITEVSRLKIQLTISGRKRTNHGCGKTLLSFKRRMPLSDESSIAKRLRNLPLVQSQLYRNSRPDRWNEY